MVYLEFNFSRIYMKPVAEKINLKKLSNSQPSHLPILPNVFKHTNQLPPEGKQQKNADDNELYVTKGKLSGRKAISVSNIFEHKSVNSTPGTYSPSLRLSIESIVLGQKLQMNAELLLLSSSYELWPISLHHLNKVERDFTKFSDCYEELINSAKVFSWEIKEVEEKLVFCQDESLKIDTKISCVNDLVNTSITLMELIYQTVYSISATCPTWKKPPTALLDRKTIISSIDDVELCCVRIREVLLRTSSTLDETMPADELESMMLYSCGQFSSALTYLAMCCRTAAANIETSTQQRSSSHHKQSHKYPTNSNSSTSGKSGSQPDSLSNENLFQLAMQSVSKSSQCLLASVKNYVEDRNPENRFITESFTNSVSASIKSFAAMATSTKFVKCPAILPASIKITRTNLFGACMNLVSPTVELLLTIPTLYSPESTVCNVNPPRSLAYSSSGNLASPADTHQRAVNCLASMRQALVQLQKTLSLYQSY